MYYKDMKKQGSLKSKYEKWEIVSKRKGLNSNINAQKIIEILLNNRGIKTSKKKDEFLNPIPPEEINIKNLGIDSKLLNEAIKRIEKALKKKEKVIIFGDYDVDGISSSAILWEYLYHAGLDVMPYIPERLSEGYGIKDESILTLKKKYPDLSLIITVDNGIVAFDAVKKATSLGIDTIIVDHHEKGERYPAAFSVIHTTKLCGAGISWIFVRELSKKLKSKSHVMDLLELAALGTISDQMSLTGANRSIVKYGLHLLNKTTRVGINSLIDISGLKKGSIGIYEINYVIAPRLNAMGRLENAIDSLRLICTKNKNKAAKLALLLNVTNIKRQKIVDEVLSHAKNLMSDKKLGKIIILSDKHYHEGVIGLAASKLTEEFFRPSLVLSQGIDISKGSARSIPGFSIIKAIRSADKWLLGGGGHEMAAGFSIKNEDLKMFKKQLEIYAEKNISDKLLEKKLKIDAILSFSDITHELVDKINKLEPFGAGNPAPTFLIKDCIIADLKKVGVSGNHLKFKLKVGGSYLDAICFGCINDITNFDLNKRVNIVFNLDENYWNGFTNLQLKIKDLKYTV